MKKIFKKSNIFSFLLGAIIFGGIGTVFAYTILAKDVGYTPKDTTWNVDNVKVAIDDLYTKAKPEYTGTTTVTPTTSNQVIATGNKILTSDITINAIPSTYKNLTTTTTATANTILSGYKAYTSEGELLTGTLSTNCVSGSYTKPANSQVNLNLGFNPSRFEMYFMNSNSNGKMLVVYDTNIGYFYQIQHPNNSVEIIQSLVYSFSNNTIVSNYATNGDSNSTYKNQLTYNYMACK